MPELQSPPLGAVLGLGTGVTVLRGRPQTLLPLHHSPSAHRAVQKPLPVLCPRPHWSCVCSAYCSSSPGLSASGPPLPALARRRPMARPIRPSAPRPFPPFPRLSPCVGQWRLPVCPAPPRAHRGGWALGGARGAAEKVPGLRPQRYRRVTTRAPGDAWRKPTRLGLEGPVCGRSWDPWVSNEGRCVGAEITSVYWGGCYPVKARPLSSFWLKGHLCVVLLFGVTLENFSEFKKCDPMVKRR